MEYMSTEIRSAREAMTIFKILGIKEITTKRQRKNGTQVFELPIYKMYGPSNKYPLRFATYESGYVRNVTECNASPYQCNKRIESEPTYFESGKKDSMDRPLYTKWTTRTCELIPNWEERIIYLAKFIIKNYYQKPTYQISDYTMDCIKAQYRQANELRNQSDKLPFGDIVHPDSTPIDDIQVIINGHRYNLS